MCVCKKQQQQQKNLFRMERNMKHKIQENDYLEENHVEKHQLLSILYLSGWFILTLLKICSFTQIIKMP